MLAALNERDKCLCHESASNRTKPLTIVENLSFLQYIVPERGLRIELIFNQQCAMRALAYLRRTQDRFAKEFRDCLSAGQTEQPPAQQVAYSERGHLLLTLKGRESFQRQRQGGIDTPG